MPPEDYSFDQQLAPEVVGGLEGLKRRRRITDLLMQQAFQPLESTQAGRFVVPPHWGQGVAQLGMALLGGHLAGRNEEQAEWLARQQRQAVVDELSDFQRRLAGPRVPERPAVPVAPPPGIMPMGQSGEPQAIPAGMPAGGTPQPTAIPTPMPGRDPRRERVIQEMLFSRNPQIRQVGEMLEKQQTREQEMAETRAARASESKEAREARAAEKQAVIEARKAETEAKLNEQALARADKLTAEAERAKQEATLRRDLQKMHDENQLAIARLSSETKKEIHGAAGGKLTEAQGRAGLFATRADKADKIISDLEGKYSPLALNYKTAAGKAWIFGGTLEAGANALLSKESQKAEQAQRDFVNAVLRQESGAVINQDEFDNARKQYFPQPGDSKEVILQKKQNRQTAIQGLTTMAGPAGRSIERSVEAQAVVPQGARVAPFHDPQKEREYQEWKKQHRP